MTKTIHLSTEVVGCSIRGMVSENETVITIHNMQLSSLCIKLNEIPDFIAVLQEMESELKKLQYPRKEGSF